MKNFAIRSNKITRHCRFCSINRHTMNHCSKYTSLESRRSRCREMGLCLFCTSASHRTEDCYGKANKLPWKCAICKSWGHITPPPLCDEADKSDNSSTASTHVCTNTGTQEQPYILPIVAITVSKGKRKYKLNCLFDTGSQRTYFSRQVIEKLGVINPSSLQ